MIEHYSRYHNIVGGSSMYTTKEKLSVQEEVILAIYHLLYGKAYDCSPKLDADHKNPVHINAQKADFFFSQMMLPVGDYGFSWNYRGPYSAALQSELRILDEKATLVSEYYQDWDARKDVKLGEIFTQRQMKRAKDAAEQVKEITSQEKGGELLGSLLYISTAVLPGYGFERVNEELQRRKEAFPDSEVNLRAWKSLEALHLVP